MTWERLATLGCVIAAAVLTVWMWQNADDEP